ncbi:MAG: hypothetical protein HYT22_01755 [Candidatus Niyogibacteria bacterium]|nr:hypothetical protein [Candidatus Niyogibacteria bacterium]
MKRWAIVLVVVAIIGILGGCEASKEEWKTIQKITKHEMPVEIRKILITDTGFVYYLRLSSGVECVVGLGYDSVSCNWPR